jgi:hypothetical protein
MRYDRDWIQVPESENRAILYYPKHQQIAVNMQGRTEAPRR